MNSMQEEADVHDATPYDCIFAHFSSVPEQ